MRIYEVKFNTYDRKYYQSFYIAARTKVLAEKFALKRLLAVGTDFKKIKVSKLKVNFEFIVTL